MLETYHRLFSTLVDRFYHLVFAKCSFFVCLRKKSIVNSSNVGQLFGHLIKLVKKSVLADGEVQECKKIINNFCSMENNLEPLVTISNPVLKLKGLKRCRKNLFFRYYAEFNSKKIGRSSTKFCGTNSKAT